MAMPKPCIQVRGLQVALSGRTVIEDTNLEVGTGEFIGLLGPNGAGKTTLMRAILGLIPSSGTCTVTGSVGYVPQRHEVEWGFPINVYRTVLSGRTGLIGWFKRPGKKDHAAAAEALRLVHMEEFASRPIEELSGGQRQPAYVAMVLCQETDYVLLDEPLNNLDISHSVDMMRHLREAAQELGRTVIVVLHDINFAARYADYICACKDGQIVEFGPAEEIMRDDILTPIFNTPVRVIDGPDGKIACYH